MSDVTVEPFALDDPELDLLIKSLSMSSDALVKKIRRLGSGHPKRREAKDEFINLADLLTKTRQEQVDRIMAL